MGDYYDESYGRAGGIFKTATCGLTEYNKILAGEVSEEFLEDETNGLAVACSRAAEEYVLSADRRQGAFVRMGSLPFIVLEHNPVVPAMQDYYDRTCVLLGHVNEKQREILTLARVDVAGACQSVYDEIIYSR